MRRDRIPRLDRSPLTFKQTAPWRPCHGRRPLTDPSAAIPFRRGRVKFIAGRSMSAISRDLSREGIATVRGGKWWPTTVGDIFANPAYVGRIRHHGDIFDGVHDAIVDEDTWQRAQDLLAARPSRGRGRPPKGSHLFRGGMLRCGECGGAMVPRTKPRGTEVYYCNGQAKLGTDFCGAKEIRRADVDAAVYRYFEQVGLDVDATRQTIAEARDRKLAEIPALARVRRDDQDGKLDADDWAEQRKQLTTERAAADAEAERLRASEAEVERDGSLIDAEAETLRRLSEIRAAIAGVVSRAESTEAVRAALSRLFENFIVHRGVPARAHVELIGETWIEPIIRERAVEGYSENLRPVLRREPLYSGKNIHGHGFAEP